MSFAQLLKQFSLRQSRALPYSKSLKLTYSKIIKQKCVVCLWRKTHSMHNVCLHCLSLNSLSTLQKEYGVR